MANGITEAFSGTETVGTTEHSMTTDTAGPDSDTTDGLYQAFLDLSALIAGDTFEWKVYEKVKSAGTQRLVTSAVFSGVQSAPGWATPQIMLMHGWDMTLKKLAGTDRSIDWSIRRAGDNADVLALLPAALVSGRMDSSVGAMAASVLTAAAIATDAITAAKIAADAITAVKIATGAITAAKFAAGAIDAAAIATGAIDADALAADAVTEMNADFITHSGTAQAGGASTITLAAGASAVDNLYMGQTVLIVSGAGAGQINQVIAYNGTSKVVSCPIAWATNPDATSVYRLIGVTAINYLYQIQALIYPLAVSILADTDNLQGRIPAALVGGRMDSSVGAMAADVVTAAAIAADAIGASELGADAAAEIAAAVGSSSAAAIADAVWDEALSGHLSAGSLGEAIRNALGLVHQNVLIDNTTHTVDGMTTSRVRVFADAAACAAATINAGGLEGAVVSYTMTTTYEGAGQMASYRMVKA